MKFSRTAVAAALLALLAAGALAAEEPFPPAPRTIENSSFWTSVQKECDTAWLAFFKEVTPPPDKKAPFADARGEGLAARASALSALSKAAAEYYAAARGTDVYERFKKYGSKMKYHDVGIMQAGISLYCDVSALLAEGKADELERFLADNAVPLMDLTRLRSKLEPRLKAHYFEIVSRFSQAMFALVRVSHDLAAARKAFVRVSEACGELVREFYLPAPSSVEVFFFSDSAGRVWLAFSPQAPSPYGEPGKALKSETKAVDEKTLASLLDGVRKAEDAYRAATLAALEKAAALLTGEAARKAEAILKRLR